MTFGIYIYCVETGKQKTTLDANGVETYSIMFALDNRTLFVIDFDDAHVTQWCLETGKPIRELKSSFGLGCYLFSSISLSTDGTLLAVSDENCIRIIDCASFSVLHQVNSTGMTSIQFSAMQQNILVWHGYSNMEQCKEWCRASDLSKRLTTTVCSWDASTFSLKVQHKTARLGLLAVPGLINACFTPCCTHYFMYTGERIILCSVDGPQAIC
jgi:WD40 repeat protein